MGDRHYNNYAHAYALGSMAAAAAVPAIEYWSRPSKRVRSSSIGDPPWRVPPLDRRDADILRKSRAYVPYSPYFMRPLGWRFRRFGRTRYRKFRRFRRRRF